MDDLTRIKGIGKAAAKKLAAAGIDTFEKLAHDGLAGEHGVKLEWIAEAAELLHAAANQNTEGKPPRPDEQDGSAEAAAVPADGGAGDPHEVTPEREDRGGGDGKPAVPAGEEPRPGEDRGDSGADAEAAAVAAALDFGAGLRPDEADIDASLGVLLEGFPLLLAAVRAFRAANPDRGATGVRIAAKRDGFRRCGLAHPKAPVEHPGNRFTPAELERLLAEPMLTVELV